MGSLQNVFSHTDTGSISGVRLIRLLDMQAAATTLAPGDYVMMLYASAANTASMNYSWMGGLTANPILGMLGSGTDQRTTANSSIALFHPFYGAFNATTASPPATVGTVSLQRWTTGGAHGAGMYFNLIST
jgi:hypothetical protein